MNRTEHLLCCLAEECNEVGQRVSKALRFGLSEIQPGQPLTNAERIVGEFLDLVAIIEMLEDENVLIIGTISPATIEEKKAKVEKFMRYAEEQGALSSPSSPPPAEG